MKTIGEILKEGREAANLTVKDISTATKIEPDYIKALEKNDFASLPPETFTKGFIRNYAIVLGKNPNDLVAIYRRDFAKNTRPKVWSPPIPSHKTTPVSLPMLRPQFLVIGLGFLVFIAYLIFQYRAVIVPPPLELTSPKVQAVVNSPVPITGKTTPDCVVTIDKDTVVRPDSGGNFTFQLNLSPGDHKLEIDATNRFGRTHSLSVPITVVSGS